MSLDVIAQHEQFLTCSFEEQKQVIVTILESYLDKGENFWVIYDYIIHSSDVSWEYLLEVYDSMLRMIYESQEAQSQVVNAHMQDLWKKTQVLREKEERERQQDRNDVSNILNY